MKKIELRSIAFLLAVSIINVAFAQSGPGPVLPYAYRNFASPIEYTMDIEDTFAADEQWIYDSSEAGTTTYGYFVMYDSSLPILEIDFSQPANNSLPGFILWEVLLPAPGQGWMFVENAHTSQDWFETDPDMHSLHVFYRTFVTGSSATVWGGVDYTYPDGQISFAGIHDYLEYNFQRRDKYVPMLYTISRPSFAKVEVLS